MPVATATVNIYVRRRGAGDGPEPMAYSTAGAAMPSEYVIFLVS